MDDAVRRGLVLSYCRTLRAVQRCAVFVRQVRGLHGCTTCRRRASTYLWQRGAFHTPGSRDAVLSTTACSPAGSMP